MSTALTARRVAGVSPRSRARTTGVVYLLFFVATILAVVITAGTFWVMRVPVAFPR